MTDIQELGLNQAQLAAVAKAGIREIEELTAEAMPRIDGRCRNGVAAALELWKKSQEPEPEPEEQEDNPSNYEGLSFGQRTAAIRGEVYPHVRKLTQGRMNFAAVEFDDLVKKVRPTFIKWGVCWSTLSSELLTSSERELLGIAVYNELLRYMIRFECVEGSHYGGEGTFRDVQVITRSFDTYNPQESYPKGDKGPKTSNTQAQKMALLQYLNLPAGDDPDFIPAASLSEPELALRQQLADRLVETIDKAGLKVEDVIAKIIEKYNDDFGRAESNILDIPNDLLIEWTKFYEEKINAAPATEGAGQVSSRADPRPEGDA